MFTGCVGVVFCCGSYDVVICYGVCVGACGCDGDDVSGSVVVVGDVDVYEYCVASRCFYGVCRAGVFVYAGVGVECIVVVCVDVGGGVCVVVGMCSCCGGVGVTDIDAVVTGDRLSHR